jgi:hypothetical protein
LATDNHAGISVTKKPTFAYGQTVFIQLTGLEPRTERLAYVPNAEASSFTEAYMASLYPTREAAEAAVAKAFQELQEDQAQDVRDGDRAEDECDDETGEFVVEGVVNEDGSIRYDGGFELAAEEIWGRFEMPVPDFGRSTPSL